MTGLPRGRVAVVGVAESDLGSVPPHTTSIDLMGQATVRALDDSGLKLSDVDGIFAATTQARFAPLMLAEYLELKPRYFDGTQVGGSSPMSHVAHAVAAIEAGRRRPCRVWQYTKARFSRGGGGAMLLTSAGRARSLRRPPVFVLFVGGRWNTAAFPTWKI